MNTSVEWPSIFSSPLMEKLYADNWQDLIQSIKSKGMRPGVSLRPGTPVEEVFPLVT